MARVLKLKLALRRNADGSRSGRIKGVNVMAMRDKRSDGGGGTLWRASNKGAEIWGRTKGRSLKISQSEAWKPGKGYGGKLYAGVAGRGRPVHSDASVSHHAQRRYRALARSGAKVYYGGSRDRIRRPGGVSWSKGDKPVFVVNPTSKPKGYRRVFHKAKLAIRVPRILVRPLKAGKAANPFKRGTKATLKRVRASLARNGAALAANQVPGKALGAAGVAGALGGPGAAAAAFTATEAAAIAGTAALGARVAHRRKLASYLSGRSKRRRGVYKFAGAVMDHDLVEKARGLIPRMGSHKLGRALGSRGLKAAKAGDWRTVRRAARAQRGIQNRNGHESFAFGDRKKGTHIRRGIYKQAVASLALIEKARGGMISGGSSKLHAKLKARAGLSRLALRGAAKSGRPSKYVRLRDAAKYTRQRRKYGAVAAGSKGERYAGYYEARRGVYKSGAGMIRLATRRTSMVRGGSRAAMMRSAGAFAGKRQRAATGYLTQRRRGGILARPKTPGGLHTFRRGVYKAMIEKARYSIKMSRAQRRTHAIRRMGGSRNPDRYRYERRPRPQFKDPAARAPGPAARSRMNYAGKRDWFTDSKRIAAGGKNKIGRSRSLARWSVNNTRRDIAAMYARTGRASPYKRTLFGGLKRVKKARGLMPRGGSGRMLRNLKGRGGRSTSHITMARQLAWRSGLDTRRIGRDGMTMVAGRRIRPKRR